MGQDMVLQEIDTKDYKELCAKYNWFASSYPPVIQDAIDSFFLPGFKFILLGVCKNVNTLSDKDAYFVSKIQIDSVHDMLFKMSEKAVGMLLEKSLGKCEGKFSLSRLTDLEAKVITSFNDYMYNRVKQFLQPAPPTVKRTNFDVIHLVFLLKDIETNAIGRFVVTLPDVLLAPSIVVSAEDKFDNLYFETSLVDVAVNVGSTRLKLKDVKQIDIDDIVVFDNSDTSHMVLKFGDYVKDIRLNPNLGLITPVENDNMEDEMEDNTNLWDSIEVEMEAEFDKVKITLGELKKIEQGLVVDLTSIYNNKVTLSVEGKSIARGELVIVNDRYGVKIDEVLTSKPKQEAIPEQSAQNDNYEQAPEQEVVQDVQEQVQEEAPSEEDEFDYSDFELEDEDI